MTINNVIFDCTTCNIFVGKHPGDVANAGNEVAFSNVENIEANHEININISNVEFTGKGLYICRANDVTISDCTFKDSQLQLLLINLMKTSTHISVQSLF